MIRLRCFTEIRPSHWDRENNRVSVTRKTLCMLVCGLLLLPGCTVLPGPSQVVENKYVLEYDKAVSAPVETGQLPVMLITVPRAHGGYDSSRFAYRKERYGLRYYAKSRWADTPARMLAPLVAEAMNHTGQFQALFASPGSIAARYRLDSELIHFYQDFTVQPSDMRIALRAQLVDLNENKVLATRLIDVREAAESEDAYGGVQAANRGTGRMLDELAQFCRTLVDR